MRKSLIGLAAGLAVIFTAGTSQAQLNKCLDQIDGLSIKLFSTYAKALKKCKVAIQKQKDNGAEADYVKAADACEKSLGSLWDINNIRGKSAISKFYDKFNLKFFIDGGKCDSDGLETAVGTAYITAMGHLIGGAQAPGIAAHDWMMRWIALMKFKLAMLEENFIFATTVNLLDDTIDGSGTDCTLPTNCDPEVTANCRPNLCATNINCRTHACQLDATSATGTSVGGGALVVSVPLTGRAAFEVCKLNPITFGITGGSGIYPIIGDSSRTVNPVSLLGQTICVDIVRSEGWCNCTGAPLALAISTAFCQDHNVNVAPACVGLPTGVDSIEGPCFCADGSGAPTTTSCGDGFAPCSSDPNNPLICGVTETGGFCHDGTTTGPVTVIPSGPAPNGSCVVLNTIQFKTLAAAPLFGPDATPCTQDDLRPPAGAASVPFTTGTASAEVKNAVLSPGACSNNGNHLCIENVNCLTNDPNSVSATCAGQTINPTQTVPALMGGGLSSCANLEASQLGGVKFVGAFPALDGAGLGDVVSTFNFDCQ